jgi:peptidase E
MRGTVVTLGGGGFSTRGQEFSPLDSFLLDLTGASRPRVCFIPTASGDAEGYIEGFTAAFSGRSEPSVLGLFGGVAAGGHKDPHMLLEQDLIYVGGGSTVNLLALWRRHGLPDILREAAARGTILAGISAGMNCWYEQSSTDSFGPLAPLDEGLGFLPGSACPHFHGEVGREETFLRWVAQGRLRPGFGVDDGAALVFRDGALTQVVSEADGATAYRVEATASDLAAWVEAARMAGRPFAPRAVRGGPDGLGNDDAGGTEAGAAWAALEPYTLPAGAPL